MKTYAPLFHIMKIVFLRNRARENTITQTISLTQVENFERTGVQKPSSNESAAFWLEIYGQNISSYVSEGTDRAVCV